MFFRKPIAESRKLNNCINTPCTLGRRRKAKMYSRFCLKYFYILAYGIQLDPYGEKNYYYLKMIIVICSSLNMTIIHIILNFYLIVTFVTE